MRQPFAARRVPCGARSRGPSRNSLHSLRSLRSDNRDESEHDARWRARPRALRSSAPHMSLPAHTHPRLCRHHQVLNRRTPRALAARWAVPGWAICGAARSAAPGSARAARFVHLTRRDCSSAANEVSAASFAARPRRPSIAAVGAFSRPRQYELAHRVPPTARPLGRPHSNTATDVGEAADMDAYLLDWVDPACCARAHHHRHRVDRARRSTFVFLDLSLDAAHRRHVESARRRR